MCAGTNASLVHQEASSVPVKQLALQTVPSDFLTWVWLLPNGSNQCSNIFLFLLVSVLLNLTGMIDVACFCSFALRIHDYWRVQAFYWDCWQCPELTQWIYFSNLVAFVSIIWWIDMSLCFMNVVYQIHPQIILSLSIIIVIFSSEVHFGHVFFLINWFEDDLCVLFFSFYINPFR